MTTTDQTSWAIERDKAYELFGGTSPYGTDDQDIADVFNRHPAAVIAEIARIADAYANGKVHTPWRALHSRLAKLEQDAQPVSLTGGTRVRLAENWIRNAGLYCPTEAEVIDELFCSNGLLAGQADQFADRMLALWRHEQPRVRLAELEQQARAERLRAGRESLAKARAGVPPAPPPPDDGPFPPADADIDWTAA